MLGMWNLDLDLDLGREGRREGGCQLSKYEVVGYMGK